MRRFLGFSIALVTLVLTLSLLPSDADGCAAVPRADRPGDSIVIAEESAVIVWDPVKKVQHFIRRAAFDTPSPDFGFLVPTPGVPTLKEVEDLVFQEADRWILPRIVTQNRYRFEPLFCMPFVSTWDMAPGSALVEKKSAVRVLGEQKVGGYETAILEADSTDALANWLKTNGYSNDPELQSWLVPYVAEKWKITAFKITQDPKTGQLATTKPVRMSFAAERPYFPYREPEVKNDKKSSGPRLLRVFFVSDAPMQGKLGNAAWHATIPWSDQLSAEQRSSLASQTGVAESDLPATLWLTTFEDRSSPRPGAQEVFFEPAPNRSPIRPPDIIRYEQLFIPTDLIMLGVLAVIAIGAVVVLRRRSAG